MRAKIDRIKRHRRTAKKKVLVAGYGRLSNTEKREARGVIRALKNSGYNVEKV